MKTLSLFSKTVYYYHYFNLLYLILIGFYNQVVVFKGSSLILVQSN